MSSETLSEQHQRGAAFHEAGHAVVGHALGLAIGRVEIAIDGDDAKGECDIEANTELSVVDQLAICVAGMEAQKLHNAPTHHGAGWGDYGRVIELLDDMEDETERRKLIDEGHQRAHDLLLQNTEKTKRIAEAVLSKMRLDADEVRLLLL